MINEENMNKLYESLVEGKELTTKQLKTCGFNAKDLKNLVDDGILERVKIGHYSLLQLDGFYEYGKNLINSKEYDKANAFFENYYELDPYNSSVCFQLFFRCVKKQEYDKAFEYFDKFFDSDNEFYNNDSDFYLYLLSMITEVPEKYRDYAKSIQMNNIMISSLDERFDNVSLNNKIRKFCLNQQFDSATRILYSAMGSDNIIATKELTRILLKQCMNVQKKNNGLILSKIKDKDYEGVISFLKNMKEMHQISIVEEHILMLAEDILWIKKDRVVPNIHIFNTDKIFEAIDKQNHDLAFTLVKQRCEEKNIDKEKDAMYLLLEEINNLIDDIRREKSNKKVNVNMIKSLDDLLDDILRYLKRQDLELAMTTIAKYLKRTNTLQFQYIIADLVKIDVLENVMNFKNTMNVLKNITKNKFRFTISGYIPKFNEALSEKKFSLATMYLDVIKNIISIYPVYKFENEDSVLLTMLEEIFKSSENEANGIKEEIPSDILEEIDQMEDETVLGRQKVIDDKK